MMYEYAVAFVVGGVGGLLLGSILYEPRERRPLFPFCIEEEGPQRVCYSTLDHLGWLNPR